MPQTGRQDIFDSKYATALMHSIARVNSLRVASLVSTVSKPRNISPTLFVAVAEYTATKSVGDMFRGFDTMLTKLATRRLYQRDAMHLRSSVFAVEYVYKSASLAFFW